MKCTVLIDPRREEEVVIYAHRESDLVKAIKQLIEEPITEWVGYRERCAIPFNVDDVFCFTVEDNRIFACLESEKLQLKSRLYQLENDLPRHFVKINQSCIANLKRVKRFDTALSGTLKVVFKNGHSDYVSRRQMKTVKERLGL